MNTTDAAAKVIDKTTSPAVRGSEKILSWICLLFGFLSILGSIIAWYSAGGTDPDPMITAHAERLGLFIGLWAPTYFILSNRFDQAAQSPLGL